jgi:hypothetical protein
MAGKFIAPLSGPLPIGAPAYGGLRRIPPPSGPNLPPKSGSSVYRTDRPRLAPWGGGWADTWLPYSITGSPRVTVWGNSIVTAPNAPGAALKTGQPILSGDTTIPSTPTQMRDTSQAGFGISGTMLLVIGGLAFLAFKFFRR